MQPDEILPDPAQEARARAITARAALPVCQSESIDDSNADIARDLRLLVRERIVAGDSDAEVIDFVVARYGEFVLFRPPFTAANAALWLVGPAFLLLGGGARLRLHPPPRRGPAAPPLTPRRGAAGSPAADGAARTSALDAASRAAEGAARGFAAPRPARAIVRGAEERSARWATRRSLRRRTTSPPSP